MKRIFIVSATLLLSLFAFTHCNHENGGENGNNDNPCAVVDADGNCYDTVHIGNQIWMKSNLRTTHFRDGSPIPLGNNMNVTSSVSGYCRPTNTDIPGYNSEIHGLYYSEAAVHDTRGLCPAGWHVPTLADWNEMAKHVCTHYRNYFNFVHNYGQEYYEEFEDEMEGVLDEYYDNPNDDYFFFFEYYPPIAKAFASQTGWIWDDYDEDNYMCPAVHPEYNNSTGFSAYPAGVCTIDNGTPFFYHYGRYAGLWTSTKFEDYSDASYIWGFHGAGGDISCSIMGGFGLPVRCVKD